VHPGYYVCGMMEITKIRSRWVLSHPYREETRHRSLRAAKLAAEY
jgi:hypothetical protein